MKNGISVDIQKREEAGKDVFFLQSLYDVIVSRRMSPNSKSYTSSLFSQGLDRIIQKVGEECVEVIVASKNNNKKEFVGEVADLLYHTLVLCVAKGTDIQDVISVLQSRQK